MLEDKSNWKAAPETKSGDFEIANDRLALKNEGERFIVYNEESFKGSFYAEASFREDDNVALALIQKKGSEPDLDNYTMIRVDKNAEGQVVVAVNDRHLASAEESTLAVSRAPS